MQSIMTRDRVDIDEILYDQSQHYLSEHEAQIIRTEAKALSYNPKMIEALYELPEQVAIALAGAIKSHDISKLAALIVWDIENYLDENGGIEQWLK